MTNRDEATRTVAIIGGGYAGCAAAVRVAELGGQPWLFEAARVLGGRARRIDYQGQVLDNGQHILSGAYTELLRLMDVVGVGTRGYVRVPLTLAIRPNFRMRAPLLPAPLHMALALMGAQGLSWRERWAAVRMMRTLQAGAFSVDVAATVAQLLTQHRQPAALIDYLWRPLTISALNTPIETASAQVFVNVLRDALGGAREASDLLIPSVDLSSLLPDAAAHWIGSRGGQVHLGQRINGVTRDDGSGALLVETDVGTRAFDAVIIAVGPHQRAAVPINGQSAAATDAYEPITTIYFAFPSAVRLADAMFGQTTGHAQWFFDRAAWAGHPPNDEDLRIVSAVISASGAHESFSQEKLAQAVEDELRSHVPDLPPPKWAKVIKEKFATFACTPSALRPQMATHVEGVFLAGDDVLPPDPKDTWRGRYPGTLESAVRSGVAAANAAMHDTKASSPIQSGTAT
ncbi:MAG: hydroxysqualene dehydroxylase HpnE [Burkholderiales bacterium]|jgi:squalene-associated FAD-dependent desaturase|nr:hydroxysqualene dehydroxylase HpnE [Nitrosomonadaceae bacterium]